MQRTKDDVAQIIVSEAKARNHTRDECLGELSALYQESEYDETVWDSTHTTYGVAQQDASYPHRFDGAPAQVKAFFDKLDVKRTSPGHGDIWLNICWLQQAPNYGSAQEWWQKGRRAYLTEIKSRIATVTPYLDRYWPTSQPTSPPQEAPMAGWTGDPTWLADVLHADGQINVRELDGWRDRGHGDFKDIRGIMFHHTGGPASAESIRDGRPDLAGPLSQLHISRTGVVTVICAGVAWHAGAGSLPWVPTNMGNWHLIGVECEWPYPGSGVTGEGNAFRCPWNAEQIKAMRNVAAAVCRKLQYGSDRVTTHKEYAGAAQGKWDPGYFDPPWFRGEVAKDLSGFRFPGEGTAVYTPSPVPAPTPPVDAHRDVLLYRGVNDPVNVRKLQAKLKQLYVSTLVVDGDYGPRTEAAVRGFQASPYRKPPLAVDGIVGPATAAALGLVL